MQFLSRHLLIAARFCCLHPHRLYFMEGVTRFSAPLGAGPLTQVPNQTLRTYIKPSPIRLLGTSIRGDEFSNVSNTNQT